MPGCVASKRGARPWRVASKRGAMLGCVAKGGAMLGWVACKREAMPGEHCEQKEAMLVEQ